MHLSADLLIQGYVSGSFPMAHPDEDNQIYWHTPEIRGIIPLDQRFRVTKNLQKLYDRNKFDLHINRDFSHVIRMCADTHEDTWISEEIIDAYTELHEQGFAHSFEAWYEGRPVGGLYGVSIGRAFFGESMYNTMTDTSKLCLIFLVEFLRRHNYQLLDTQYLNPHTAQFGGYEIPREEYMKLLEAALSGKP